MTTKTSLQDDATHELPLSWGWILAQGVLTLLFGVIALYLAGLTTLATVYMFGGLMGAGGVLQLIQTFTDKDKTWSQRLANALIGLIYILTSALIFIDPLAATLALTIMIAALFTAIGVIRLAQAWNNRKRGWRWLWLALFGLVNIGFGAFVILTLPATALWLIGMMVSIELIMHGWLLIIVALAARKTQKA